MQNTKDKAAEQEVAISTEASAEMQSKSEEIIKKLDKESTTRTFSGTMKKIFFVLCILGSYALRNNMFDVGAMLLIAVIGYFFLKLEIPIAPIVLALILGPLAESNLRRSLLLSQGSASIFFTRPICIFFLLLAVLSLCWPLLRKVLSNRKKAA